LKYSSVTSPDAIGISSISVGALSKSLNLFSLVRNCFPVNTVQLKSNGIAKGHLDTCRVSKQL
jgi:hypothetical protein